MCCFIFIFRSIKFLLEGVGAGLLLRQQQLFFSHSVLLFFIPIILRSCFDAAAVLFFCSSCIFPYCVFWRGEIGVEAFCAWGSEVVVVGAAVLFDKTFFRKLFTCGGCILY